MRTKHLMVTIYKNGNGNKQFKILSQNNPFFPTYPSLNMALSYKPSSLLDDDECFYIPNFSVQPYYLSFLTKNFSSANYDTFSPDDFSKINYLWAYQDGKYYFQNVSKVKLYPKKMIILSDAFIFKENASTIIVHENADAIYDPTSDNLYFKKLEAISGIFKGIAELFREATDKEVTYFLRSPFIQLQNGFDTINVQKSNRKYIALVREALESYTTEQLDQIIEYTRKYCQSLIFENDAFVISNEGELRKLLQGLTERFYTTEITGKKQCANSVTSIE